MTDTKTNPDREALLKSIKTMGRRAAAESAVHLTMASICRDGHNLESGQKADLVTAVLDVYRNALLSEFLWVLTSPKDDAPYELLLDKSPEKMRRLQAAIAASVIRTDDLTKQCTDKLQTMFEVFFPKK